MRDACCRRRRRSAEHAVAGKVRTEGELQRVDASLVRQLGETASRGADRTLARRLPPASAGRSSSTRVDCAGRAFSVSSLAEAMLSRRCTSATASMSDLPEVGRVELGFRGPRSLARRRGRGWVGVPSTCRRLQQATTPAGRRPGPRASPAGGERWAGTTLRAARAVMSTKSIRNDVGMVKRSAAACHRATALW